MQLKKITTTTRKVLCQRGYTDADINILVNPTSTDLPTPESIPNLTASVEKWLSETPLDSHILVYGDYDVDGISATAILVKYLRHLGFTVTPFIPSRINDGYGLKLTTLERIKFERFNSIVIVDSGTSEQESHQAIARLNIPCLILDHHTPSKNPEPSKYISIVNPRTTESEEYPCSATLAYFAVKHMSKILEQEVGMEGALGLAALASVADVVPITRANHTIIKIGLAELKKIPGIKALMQLSFVTYPTVESVGWKLSPRLNATGRMGDASKSLELILADKENVKALAKEIEEVNSERRKIQDEALANIAQEAKEQAAKGAVVIKGPWNQGIVGIIAAQISSKYHTPTIILAEKDGKLHGSGRIPNGYSLIELLEGTSIDRACYGGHTAAIGIHLPVADFERLKSEVQIAAKSLKVVKGTPKIEVEIELQDINNHEVYALESLHPFGEEFKEPIFGIKGQITKEGDKFFIVQDTRKKPIELEDKTIIANLPEIIPIYIRMLYSGKVSAVLAT